MIDRIKKAFGTLADAIGVSKSRQSRIEELEKAVAFRDKLVSGLEVAIADARTALEMSADEQVRRLGMLLILLEGEAFISSEIIEAMYQAPSVKIDFVQPEGKDGFIMRLVADDSPECCDHCSCDCDYEDDDAQDHGEPVA